MKLAREIKRKWRPRALRSHKGNFGRLLILAGSRGLTGAAHLAGVAALRTGAGLVTLGVPEAVYQILARREAEVMVNPFPSTREGSLATRALRPILTFLKGQEVLALGPGLSQNPGTRCLVRRILSKTRCPVVLDADGINAFKGYLNAFAPLKDRAILTPHPGEFKRSPAVKLASPVFFAARSPARP